MSGISFVPYEKGVIDMRRNEKYLHVEIIILLLIIIYLLVK